MNPVRWKEIEQLCESAIAMEPSSREEYLEEACAGDESLRKEVEGLLAQQSKAERFLKDPAIEAAAKVLAANQEHALERDLVGRTISHYRIIEKIGQGGMGVIYRAHDVHLDRSVALKMLPPEKMTDAERKRRFIHEAKAASALNHPNIITIHEISRAEGIDFIAMEYVAGKPLAQLIAGNGLPLSETLKYAIQIADALQNAHKAGIIHRDLKPSNIMVTEDSLVKILDFGLAKLSHPERDSVPGATKSSESFTGSGVIVGTAAYMSPEQAQGKEVDACSDIFSFGAVLYEMITGRRAFKGDSNISTLAAVLHDEPDAVDRIVQGIPSEFGSLIRKTLEKDRTLRYQNASDLVADLRRLQRDSESGRTVPELTGPRWKKRRVIAFSSAITIMLGPLLILLNVVGLRDRLLGRANVPEIRSLAVLPLADLSGDSGQEYFAEGVTDALISELGKIRALRVISHTSVMRYKGTQKSLQEISRELKVDGIVEGSVLRSGNRVKITARLVEAQSERRVWGDTVERDLRDILTLQSELASGIGREIRVKLAPQEHLPLAAQRSVDPQAHDFYLIGRHLMLQSPYSPEKAIGYLEQAVARDPQFALAYAVLARAYSQASFSSRARELIPKARAAARKALELDDTLAEAHVAHGQISTIDWNWAAAEKELKRAIELDPNSAVAHRIYGSYLIAMRRFDEAITEFTLAKDLDPIPGYSNLGWAYNAARRYEEAIASLGIALELNPGDNISRGWLARTYLYKGMYAEALKEFEKAGLHGDNPELVNLHALAGRKSEARAMLNRLERAWAKAQYVDWSTASFAYAGLGDVKGVCACLNRAHEERDAELPWLFAKDPYFDKMLDAPCFLEVKQRLNLAY